MDKKVRMADIAQKLGISVVSVSKALSGKDGVSSEMREKILLLAKEMGYVPLRNKPQKMISEGITGNIGILVADRFFTDNAFYSSLYRHISVKCNESGMSALLEIISLDAERTGQIPAMIQGNKADGIIVMGELQKKYLQVIKNCGLPYLLLDFYDDDSLEADGITSDNVSGGYQLTKHLIDSGKRNVAFVGSIHSTTSIMDRFLGYTKAVLRAKETIRMDWIIEDRDEDGEFIPIQLPQEMPQGFLCSCDEVAYNLVELLKQKGYRVPEDIGVAGYDDYRYALISSPQLTTYHVSVEEMASAAVKQIVYRIKGKHAAKGSIVVKGYFVKREST